MITVINTALQINKIERVMSNGALHIRYIDRYIELINARINCDEVKSDNEPDEDEPRGTSGKTCLYRIFLFFSSNAPRVTTRAFVVLNAQAVNGKCICFPICNVIMPFIYRGQIDSALCTLSKFNRSSRGLIVACCTTCGTKRHFVRTSSYHAAVAAVAAAHKRRCCA